MSLLRTANDYFPALLVWIAQSEAIRAEEAAPAFERAHGHLIPTELLHRNSRGQQRWLPMLLSAREYLARLGLMNDYTSDVWALTETGRRWLRDHPDGGEEALQQLLQQRARSRRTTQTISQNETENAQQRTNEGAHRILDRQIAQIRRFLKGVETRPSDEILCDWVYLCYTYELYYEGHRLFSMIDATIVLPAIYERAKKLARACQLAIERSQLER
jgi:hypothetical protein